MSADGTQVSMCEVELSRNQIATLRALSVNAAHAPIDGMRLDELRLMRLIEFVPGGYALTEDGYRQLQNAN
jgi:hypothetical protein